MADPGPAQPGGQGDQAHPKSRLDREMVNWTRAVAIFTFCLVATSAVSDWFIFQQWSVANKAQTDTREQLRAVVGGPTFNEFIINDKDGKPLAYAFQPQYFNSGGTRTGVFRGWQSIHPFEGEVPNNLDFSRPLSSIDIPDGVIPANSPSNVQPVTLSADDVTKVVQKQETALIWGHADWADIFEPNKVHHIGFCMKLESISLIGGPQGLKPVPYRPDCNYSD